MTRLSAVFWDRYRGLVPIWTKFVGALALAAALDEWANEWVNARFSAATARLTAWTLRLLGHEARAEAAVVRSPMCSFEVIGECTAYYPAAIFLAAVVAYPCRWRAKTLGIGLGIPAVLILNQLRLVSLCYLFRWHPAHVETAHVLVWQSLIVFLTLLLWLVWVATVARQDATATT